jgi:hypothetical protein
MMDVLEKLMDNKGTISSALSKQLAHKVLAGDTAILKDAVRLAVYRQEEHDSRHIRSGAAKIIEETAQARPELVVKHLPSLIPALETGEPQTRWMIIRTFGFCAALDQVSARRAVPFVEKYILTRSQLCLKSSADLFLGDLGAVSRKDAAAVFPILEKSMGNLVRNEQDWILESMIKMAERLDEPARRKARAFAHAYETSSRKSTRTRVAKLLGALGG